MTDIWYYIDADNETRGPIKIDGLRDLLRTSVIGDGTLVWSEGMADWEAAGRCASLRQALGVPPTPSRHSAPAQAVPGLRPAPSDRVSAFDEGGATAQRAFHPWRRLFARYADMMIVATIFGFIVGVAGLRNSPISQIIENDVVFTMLCFALLIPVEAFMLATFGSTVGKVVYGIHLAQENGEPLGFGQAFSRSFGVYIQGIALGIPLISLVAMYLAYRTLKREGRTSWDARTHVAVAYDEMSWGRIIAIVLFWVAMICLVSFGIYVKTLAR